MERLHPALEIVRPRPSMMHSSFSRCCHWSCAEGACTSSSRIFATGPADEEKNSFPEIVLLRSASILRKRDVLSSNGMPASAKPCSNASKQIELDASSDADAHFVHTSKSHPSIPVVLNRSTAQVTRMMHEGRTVSEHMGVIGYADDIIRVFL